MDFQQQVIQRSFEVPVVVDFWAPWCGPCRTLGPVIEQLATEAEGRWELIKLNTEEDQQTAMQYQIRSIPAVKMFSHGEVVAEFTGALSRHQILAWLDEFLPNPGQEALQKIVEDWINTDPRSFSETLEAFLQTHPSVEETSWWLMLSKLGTAPEAIYQEASSAAPGVKWMEFKEDLLTLSTFLQTNPGGSEHFVQTWQKAQEAFKTGHIEESLSHLIETVMLDKSFADELPRKATVALFRRIGQQHPVSKKYQRRFSMALY